MDWQKANARQIDTICALQQEIRTLQREAEDLEVEIVAIKAEHNVDMLESAYIITYQAKQMVGLRKRVMLQDV